MASGFYHRFNVLKYRILGTLLRAEKPITTQDISNRLGIDRKKVSDELSHWHKQGYGYAKRLKVKTGRFYQYQIGKKGIEAYRQYDGRFKRGLSLNQRKSSPKKVSSVLDYFGINRYGEDLGYSQEELPRLAGLKKSQ